MPEHGRHMVQMVYHHVVNRAGKPVSWPAADIEQYKTGTDGQQLVGAGRPCCYGMLFRPQLGYLRAGDVCYFDFLSK